MWNECASNRSCCVATRPVWCATALQSHWRHHSSAFISAATTTAHSVCHAVSGFQPFHLWDASHTRWNSSHTCRPHRFTAVEKTHLQSFWKVVELKTMFEAGASLLLQHRAVWCISPHSVINMDCAYERSVQRSGLNSHSDPPVQLSIWAHVLHFSENRNMICLLEISYWNRMQIRDLQKCFGLSKKL